MIRRLIAIAAAIVVAALLLPAVFLGDRMSSFSIIVLGVAFLGGVALVRDESPTARRAGRISAVIGVAVLVLGLVLIAVAASSWGY